MESSTTIWLYIQIAIVFLFPQYAHSEILYVNNHYGYEITLPDGWTYTEEDNEYLLIKRNNSFGANCSLILAEDNKVITSPSELTEYVKHELFDDEGNSSIYTIDRLQSIKLNYDVPGVILTITQQLKKEVAEKLKAESRITGKEIVVFTIKNNVGYYLRCKDIPKNEEKNKNDFEYIVSSFNFVLEK